MPVLNSSKAIDIDYIEGCSNGAMIEMRKKQGFIRKI
jgi:hypothetical protein